MKRIIKNASPSFFEDWKAVCLKCWEDLDKRGYPENSKVKKDLKVSLLDEQGYICCYCQSKIDINTTILEHLKCRERHKSIELEYGNILASCLGGQVEREGKGQREKKGYPLYCDQKKGNKDISVAPTDDNCEERFVYGTEGMIFPTKDEDIEAEETIKTLNLNCSVLVNRRKAAIEGYWNDTTGYPEGGQAHKIINDLSAKDTGKFKEFSGVIISFLSNMA